MNFLTRMVKRYIDESQYDEVLDSFYGIKFPIDEEEVKRREAKVAKLKKELGIKYLLAKKIERKDK